MGTWHIEVRGRLFFHFAVVAGNGQTVLVSETYFSRGNAVRAARLAASEFGWEFPPSD